MITEEYNETFKPKSFVNRSSLHSKNQKAHIAYLKKKRNKINNHTNQHEFPKYNQIGELAIYLQELSSSLNSNYQAKGKRDIGEFKRTPLSKSTILKYKKTCNMLSHIRYEERKIDGCILIDNTDRVVAVLSVEEKNNGQKWIQAMEITKQYRGYGLSKQLLELATGYYGAGYLSVNKNNQIAIKIYKDYGFYQYEDTDTMIFMRLTNPGLMEFTLLEALTNDAKPIFIVNSWTATPAGHIIRLYTNSTYTHSSIAFDTSLAELYTFNADNKLNKFGGMSKESLQDYIDYYADCKINVKCLFVKERDFIKMKKVVDHMISSMDKTTYDFLDMFNILFNRAKKTTENTMSMICSQFVSYILSIGDINIVDKSYNLTTPKDFVMASNPKLYQLYDGYGKDYDKKRIDRIFRKLKQKAEYIKECAM